MQEYPILKRRKCVFCYDRLTWELSFWVLPSYLDDIVAEGYVPEEEILSILNVPPGKMGRVIGRKGASIQSVKESCQYAFSFLFCFLFCSAEIIIGGAKGPPDKVKAILNLRGPFFGSPPKSLKQG
ncbi:hypothetical protein B296_00008044 [Ensete ventricosum]|uniref:K Homology domain-containing protein n=1 Tax=Ensete ventricosum TaxID=4639 RepID=A0A427B474_ENSVE|nr:hypothetical protein B296_00008044 [Ensete ventricosum]